MHRNQKLFDNNSFFIERFSVFSSFQDSSTKNWYCQSSVPHHLWNRQVE